LITGHSTKRSGKIYYSLVVVQGGVEAIKVKRVEELYLTAKNYKSCVYV
jgi:hypothetical protein